MHNCLICLCRSSSQAMYPHHISAAHVGKEGADGSLFRRDRDIYIAALHKIHISRLAYERHDLPYPESFCHQRRHNIYFIIIILIYNTGYYFTFTLYGNNFFFYSSVRPAIAYSSSSTSSLYYIC